MGRPDPERHLHANRPFTTPYSSSPERNTFSRSSILLGRQNAAFGSSQSMGVCAEGESENNPATHPKKWPAAGTLLRVPKCVILSTLPFWTAYWKSCYFYGPSDIIGQMFTPPFLFGNYYYFDQWDDVDTTSQTNDPRHFCDPILAPGGDCGDLPTRDQILSSPFWDNFNPPVSDQDKELYTENYLRRLADIPPSSVDTINQTTTPPSPRYSQIIGHISTNPYYQLHNQLLTTFAQVKNTLESDPTNPIYVIVPEWLPRDIRQTRNGYLKKVTQTFNTAHGTGCSINDTVPCYTNWDIAWGPAHPDPNNPHNRLQFTAPNTPWLATTDPGFGTNTLHLYVGHPCVRYSPGDTIFDYQAWPLTPEGQFLGPIFQSNYTGAGLPFFQGRRNIWRDAGFNYGYATPYTGIFNNYRPLIEAEANHYKDHFFKYRQFSTHIFTYPATWSFSWNLPQLWQDQRSDCHATQFYFGFEFADFQAAFSNRDHWYADCSQSPEAGPSHIKIAESISNDPSSEAIETAIGTFYPPIRARVEAYYNGIEPGSAQFFQHAIDQLDLADYNVEFRGSFAPLLDADAIVEYVREYFAKNP